MSDLLLQLSVGGIFAILVLKEVFAFLQRWRSKNFTSDQTTTDRFIGGIHERMWKVDRLYDWHDARDEEGVPLWYVRKHLEEAVKSLSVSIDGLKDSIREQNALLQKMIERIESLQANIGELHQGQSAIEQILRELPEQLKSAK